MRILVVDDHVLFREGLVSLLKAQPDFCVVGEAGSVKEAIARAQDLKPDTILMDFTLPDGSGAEATRAILNGQPHIKIVFMTFHEDDEILLEAVRSGAKGYLLKNLPVSKLISSLQGLQKDEAAISRKMMARLLAELARGEGIHSPSSPVFDLLTPREVDILAEITRGASNSEIAAHLFISVSTVKIHISHLLKKAGLKNRRELAAFAKRHDLMKA